MVHDRSTCSIGGNSNNNRRTVGETSSQTDGDGVGEELNCADNSSDAFPTRGLPDHSRNEVICEMGPYLRNEMMMLIPMPSCSREKSGNMQFNESAENPLNCGKNPQVYSHHISDPNRGEHQDVLAARHADVISTSSFKRRLHRKTTVATLAVASAMSISSLSLMYLGMTSLTVTANASSAMKTQRMQQPDHLELTLDRQDVDPDEILLGTEEQDGPMSGEDIVIQHNSNDNNDEGDEIFDYGVQRLYNPSLKFRVISESSSETDSRAKPNFSQAPNAQDDATSTKSDRDSVLILATVDGTLAGILRSSGEVLWKQSRENYSSTASESTTATESGSSSTSPNDQGDQSIASSIVFNRFLSPLVSTTTTSSSSSQQQQFKFHAVPSIDGTVYLTVHEDETLTSNHRGSSSSGGKQEQTPNMEEAPIHELALSTHIRDLVDRAPFVDAHGRFFVGSRKAMVAAVDERTGEILRVIPKWKGVRHKVTSDTEEFEENREGYDADGDEELLPSLAGRDVVWIGRLEHTITVHDLSNGKVDIEFSVAEILSVDEMIRGSGRSGAASSMILRNDGGVGRDDLFDDGGDEGIDDSEEYLVDLEEESANLERLFTSYITEALRHPSFGDRVLELPSPEEEMTEGDDVSKDRTKSSSVSRGSPLLVSTPGGNVAFRDSVSTSSGWISFQMLDSPVVYAIEGATGQKVRVNILPDVPVSNSDPTSESGSSSGLEKDDFHQMLERQIASMTQQAALLASDQLDATSCDSEGENGNNQCRHVVGNDQGSVVSALDNGQLYALPLGVHSSSKRYLPLGLPPPNSVSSGMVKVQNSVNSRKRMGLTTHHNIALHSQAQYMNGGDVDSGDKQRVHIDPKTKHLCIPSSPLYPGCLVGASLPISHMMEHLLDAKFGEEVASAFASSDIDFDLYLDMLEENNRKKNSYFNQFVKIMSSWIAPIVALIFVLSFELGRRERLKAESKGNVVTDSPGDEARTNELAQSRENNTNNQGVIQLTDEILGYGGHGTIVYKGVLDKRQVAVKRLLNMYHASADREISLLIESDGHPNVVRYFLKEVRGDFVYLALELCDMSLNDLIVSLSKLKNVRKERFQPSEGDDFESAIKSLLFQIASGVKHIHSLRIVHRDLKPQNILLAQKCKSKPAIEHESSTNSDSETEIEDSTIYSDTNSILESFKNGDYVPKISDMGLGKQLVGQSSFGISTLGTGSVGAGPAANPSMAGAGAGSVGWQAPEVMALRWSPESSSLNDESMIEASPLEVSVNRTSRSVDIFSLGCIFYCTILPGSHPFGEWYEREANIMKNRPNKDDLEFVAPDASDLILSMINRDAKARPTAEEVCDHPFFWSLAKRLKFLCELSDRLELSDAIMPESNAKRNLPTLNTFSIEKGAVKVFGSSWEKKLDPELMESSLNRRTYDPSSVRDCLRMIRNKHHHYEELSSSLKSRIGSNTDGLSRYFDRKFPCLLMHCYRFCLNNMEQDDSFAVDYKLPITKQSSRKTTIHEGVPKSVVSCPESAPEEKKNYSSLEPISDSLELDAEVSESNGLDPPELLPARVSEYDENDTDSESDKPPTPVTLNMPKPKEEKQLQVQNSTEEPVQDDLTDIVVWSGSNAARKLNCRGWMRSEDEWVQRLDAKLRKRDVNLARCADDPKFRTRLCNHWDVSRGTYCPMRKKNKCIFAHGPVELRVKEGKRHRWGTLVNKHGLCANAKASGGEDTYGAARSIENTRKEQGQWSVEATPKRQQGKGKSKGKQSSNKKKDQKSQS